MAGGVSPTRPTATVWNAEIAKRALRHVGLLAFGEDVALADRLVSEQYRRADNMTDSLAALRAVAASCRAAMRCWRRSTKLASGMAR